MLGQTDYGRKSDNFSNKQQKVIWLVFRYHFVASNVGEDGSYENIGEYIRDLIRRDKERTERESFERLKAELALAFAAPDDTFHPLSVSQVITRNKSRPDA